MYITCLASDATTGLSPTVRIRKISDSSLVVTNAAMTDMGDGGYSYDFSTAEEDTDYWVRVDFGSTFTGQGRYQSAQVSSKNPDAPTVGEIWNYTLPTKPSDGSAAKYLRSSGPNIDVASGALVGYNGLSAKDAKKEFESIKAILEDMKAKDEEEDDSEDEMDVAPELDIEEMKRSLSDEVRNSLASVGDIGKELDQKVTVAVMRAVDGLKTDVMKYAKKQLSEEEEFADTLKNAELMAKIEILESSVARLQESDMMKSKELEKKEKEIEANRKKLEKLKSALS